MPLYEEWIPFIDSSGEIISTLRVVCESNSPIAPIIRLPKGAASDYSEEPVQLLEGFVYEYELDTPGFSLDKNNPHIKPSHVGTKDGIDRGKILTGNRTGLLKLHLLDPTSETSISVSGVEVRSSKIGYRTDYRRMLDDIAAKSVDLVLNLRGTTETRIQFDPQSTTESLQQQFFFIKGIIESTEFHEAMSMIISRPHNRLDFTTESVDITRGLQSAKNLSRQISCGTPRIPVPSSHPLSVRLGTSLSLPSHIEVNSAEETLDTPENRFIRYALDEFSALLSEIVHALSRDKKSHHFLLREVYPVSEKIYGYITSTFLRHINNINSIPINSPVLQRKAGYREILKLWIKSGYALQLTWSGGDQIYTGGLRDVAKLYEYWVFFLLLDAVSNLIGINSSDIASTLIKQHTNGLGLRLKSGTLFKTEGHPITANNKEFKVQFSYNRTFASPKTSLVTARLDYESAYPKRGSWTRTMQPDYTISIWPAELSAKQAEYDDKMSHVHFDAKYRLNTLADAFGYTDDNDPEYIENKEISNVTSKDKSRDDYKRIDLLKMHAYKDAIRRSQGAYIIYPGIITDTRPYRLWSKYHEVIPGLGAFCVRPDSTTDNSVDVIQSFLSDILDNLATKDS